MKPKFSSLILTAIIMLSVVAFWNFSPVEATTDNQPIILPFWTGWEKQSDGTPIPGQAYGRTNSVDWSASFSSPRLEQIRTPDYQPSDKDSWTESTSEWYGGDSRPYLSTYRMVGQYSVCSDSYSSLSVSTWGTLGRTNTNHYPYTKIDFWLLLYSTRSIFTFKVFLMEDENNYFYREESASWNSWKHYSFDVGTQASGWNMLGNPYWNRVNDFRVKITSSLSCEVTIRVDELYFTVDKQAFQLKAFGYDGMNCTLAASGRFDASYSYCYFNLFDHTSESDYQPPFKLKPQTFINIWYYHYQLANCMIDAQLFNKRTRRFWTLSDFNYDGEYIVDQNGVRIHPACRYNDPIGSWEFACFDLSIIYNNDPGNWYITKIWIAFDNDPSIGDGATGTAGTYFDLLHITYGASWSYTARNSYNGVEDTCSASIIAWESYLAPDGYKLKLKVTVSGYTEPWSGLDPILGPLDYTPRYLNVDVRDRTASVEGHPEPLGVNLEQKNESLTEVWECAMDCASAIIGSLPYGELWTAYELASKFYGLITTTGGATYQWPKAKTVFYQHPDYILGEAYISVFQLSEGLNTIDILCWTDYYYWLISDWYRWWSVPVEFYFEWNNQPDPLCMDLYTLTIEASEGGTTDPPPGTYGYENRTIVSVHAIPDTGFSFAHWFLDGIYYYENPINVTMNTDHELSAYFYDPSSGGGSGGDPGTCPTLFVWNGSGYVDYGVINIHNPSGEDIIREVPIRTEDVGISNYKAVFRLREGWPGLNFSESLIDQVKLYTVDSQGNRHLCPLISAEHSRLENVLPQLLLSDDYKAQMLLLETIDLKFLALYQNIQSYVFVIEGCNMLKE